VNLRPWLLVFLVILIAAAIRIRLLDIPLERDEGEYAYAGQLMLQGIPPYLLACNMKLPGTYAAYALILGALGQSVAAIHLGLLLVNAAAILLLFLLGRRLFGPPAGLAACAAYALMSAGAGVMGTQAHATHFVVLAALAGALLLLRGSLWWGGLLFGLAFVMKQHGIFFAIFGALWLISGHWRHLRQLLPKLALFLAGAATPFVLTCLILWRAGVFARFWFWTFTYARQYASENSLSDGVAAFSATFPPIFKENAALWILAAAGLFLVGRKKELRASALFAALFLVFSFLAICPGLYFREHYFVLALPAVALLAGAIMRNRLTYCLFGVALLLSLATQQKFLFRMSPLQASREIYGLNPFPEALAIAAYISSHSAWDARVAVLGSEPEIYFYSHRHSATSYIYMYGLMEPQPYALTMQNDMIREVETNAPEFIVYVAGDESWLRQTDSPKRLDDWWSAYRPAHYHLVDIADILAEDHTEYRWDYAAQDYHPQSDHYVQIYRSLPPIVSR